MSKKLSPAAAAKPISGGRRITLAGKKHVAFGLSPEDYDTLRRAADVEKRPLTQFLVYHGLQAAKDILAELP